MLPAGREFCGNRPGDIRILFEGLKNAYPFFPYFLDQYKTKLSERGFQIVFSRAGVNFLTVSEVKEDSKLPPLSTETRSFQPNA
jgi:hypothetical protein